MVSVNHIKPDPVGIDEAIQDIQKELYTFLGVKWQGAIQGFGRVHRNQQAWQSVVPQWYVGAGDYKDVYYDDNFAGNFFFIEDQTHETPDETVFNAKVKLAFMINLDKVLPGFPDRPDERARVQVATFLRDIARGRYVITGVQKGIDAVFLGFEKDRIHGADTHPKHTFCVRMTLTYYMNDC